jgi:hypothetical protein
MQDDRPPHEYTQQAVERMALGLGVFSIGLGLAELIAPRRMATLAGLRGADTRADTAVRALGAREVAHGLSILARPAAAPAVWARVGGDLIDLCALGAAARSYGVNRGAATVSAAALLGATAMDVFVAGRLSSLAGAERRTVQAPRRSHGELANIDRPSSHPGMGGEPQGEAGLRQGYGQPG